MTPVIKLILIILLPWIVAFFVLRNRFRFRLFAFAGIFAVQLFAIAPMAYIAASVVNNQPESNESLQLASIYANQYRVSQGQLHGLTGWQGVDITAGCGSPIYAPFSGIVTYVGLDGYNHVDDRGAVWEQATMLTIRGDNGLELTLLHGDYLVEYGEKIQANKQVGKESNHGWTTGCHSHVILKQNGQTLNFLTWQNEQKQNRQLATNNNLLRISTYDPSKCYDAAGNVIKNTNCDSNPTKMASGDNTFSWIGGKNGIYAAACPRSDGWHHGLRFELDGTIYECRDTGGWINCYQPGQIDLAIQNAHSKGYLLDVPAIAEISYCWVDLLNGSQYQYGSLAYNWKFIQ